MKNQLLILFAFIFLLSCNSRNEVTISYTVKNGHICLPVTIAGQEFDFIFDTGAGKGILNYQVMQTFGIRPTTKCWMNMYTYGGPFTDTIYQANREFSIGSLKFDSASFNLDFYNRSFGLEKMIGKDYCGILGVKEIQTKNWLFNLKEKIVTISNTEIDESRINSSLDLCLKINPDSTLTIVDVLLNDSLTVPFLFDTGAVGPFSGDYGGKQYCFANSITLCDSLSRHLEKVVPVDAYFQLVSKLKMNNLILDTLSVSVAEKKTALFYPDIPLRYPDVISCLFLDNFNFMLYDKDRMQICLYGFHNNNQGEKDFLKIIQRNKK